MAYITGNDGNVTFGDDYKLAFNTWSATLTRASTDVTAFGDAAKRRRLGVLDFSGSAGGHFISGATHNDPGGIHMAGGHDPDGFAGAVFTVATSCTISATVVVSSVGYSVDKNGDSTGTINFELSGGSAPTMAWSESG
tara:strand:- start:1806 stop:2219 length:414 start_codon:yes stop_codon:yes gene_type:complete